MRLHFQAVPWDLYVALGYAVVVSGVLLALGVGNPFAVVLVILIPGYLAVAALFPGAEDLDWVTRFALSAGMSLALVALLGLILDVTPWGITYEAEALSTLAASVVLGGVALRRRLALPKDQRFELTLSLRWTRWGEYTLLEKGLVVVLVAILAVALPLYGRSLLQRPPQEPFTELYLLGPTGNFSGIPNRLNVSEPATVDAVVSSHEGVPVAYSLQVRLLGVLSVYNATLGAIETVVVNATTWSWFNFTLASGSAWGQAYTFAIPTPGTWWVSFELFRNGDFAAPYRSVHVLIAVP